MSEKHPIIAITGSSGSGASEFLAAFKQMIQTENANYARVDGNGFHKYNHDEFAELTKKACGGGKCIDPTVDNLSHFDPSTNMLDKLEGLFKEYGESGTGEHREYFHNDESGVKAGTFSEWKKITGDADLLLYHGLHGNFKLDSIDIPQYVDLKIGVVPVVNLEWIQKIHRDTGERGYSTENVTDAIMRRLHDYVHYITPQFTHTDINFQRVPFVDTSNPFIARDVPTLDESMIVIRIGNMEKIEVNFSSLLNRIDGSFMSRRNTIVVPGGKLSLAMRLILSPTLRKMIKK
ncbi:MAG: phosphoribulokinase [Methylococcales bacterium]|jgi:phosphoribulokinase|nr:phosphoribulokinase [Methylococcales bacterium]